MQCPNVLIALLFISIEKQISISKIEDFVQWFTNPIVHLPEKYNPFDIGRINLNFQRSPNTEPLEDFI